MDSSTRDPRTESSQDRFLRLWMQAQAHVTGYVRSLVPDIHESSDILQEVALTCMKKMDEYDPARSFVKWCVGIARIEILRHHRSSRRHLLLEHEDVAISLADVYETMHDELEERQKALQHCVRELSERSRMLVQLRYYEKRPIRAIARQVQATTNAIKVALSRIRGALRECIDRRLKEAGVR